MSILAELRRRWLLVVIALVAFVLLFAQRVAIFLTDVMWFRSVNFESVFWTVLTSRVGLGVAGGLILAILLAANLLLARRLAPPYRIPSLQEEAVERYRELVTPFAVPLLLIVSLVVGTMSGLSLSRDWDIAMLWLNQVPFGVQDPQFGRDLGFFVFELPFLTRLNSWLFTSLVLTIVLSAVAHYVFGGIRPQAPGQKIAPAVNVHLSVLLAGLVGVRAWGFVLDQFNLAYSERGTVTGLSYTDVNAQLLAFQLLAIIAAVCVVLFLVNIWIRGWLLPAAGVGLLVVAAVVLSGIYPAAVQRLQVAPQELEREREYIARNLELTRFAFGIDDVQYEQFEAASTLAGDEVRENQRTLESMRLWDPATLQNTYKQLQEFRPYYDFRDVDVDRYEIDGELQQVMISVRELSERDLPSDAQTWENMRLLFTHGYGLVASDVSSASNQGQPVFLVNNIPPTGVDKLEVENPRIYFGESPPQYSIVNSGRAELDFPLAGGTFETYEYTGDDGVPVGTMGSRLAFALRYAEPNFLLSNLIEPRSRILFNRNIRERVELVAPFLQLDHDPYPVAADGRIKWILDGYTTTDMIPYSERVNLEDLTQSEARELRIVQGQDGQAEVREVVVDRPGLVGRANYIRNSVKAVVDAYDGTITLYAVDPDDPVLEAWRNVFPEAVVDLAEATDDLQRHFRYPEDMFRVQAEMFRTYHIESPDEFYSREDAWNIPVDAAFNRNQQALGANQQRAARDMRPYYLLMRLPGETAEEFALIQPFTPAERPNLIAWLAGRSDGDAYGQLRAYIMPPNRTVFGPEQVQSRIDQDGTVANQITLWNQSGSTVIYGNLLVIPVEDSLMYVQPLFLRARGDADLPELQRVVIVFGDNVVMEEDLQSSLIALFGDDAPSLALPADAADVVTEVDEDEDGETGDGFTLDPEVRALVTQAEQALVDAEEALRNGDLGEYSEKNREAAELISQIRELVGGIPAVPVGGEEPEDEEDPDDPDDPDAGLPSPDEVDGDVEEDPSEQAASDD